VRAVAGESVVSVGVPPAPAAAPIETGVRNLATLDVVLVEEEVEREEQTLSDLVGCVCGDMICACGYWTPVAQNRCQRGGVRMTLHIDTTPHWGVEGQSAFVENRPGQTEEVNDNHIASDTVIWNCLAPGSTTQMGFTIQPLAQVPASKPQPPQPPKAKRTPKATVTTTTQNTFRTTTATSRGIGSIPDARGECSQTSIRRRTSTP
jgi:hypothetical protein